MENVVLAPIVATGVMASGAVEDTLKACLSRIPSNASAESAHVGTKLQG